MGVLAQGSAHAQPSARPPIDTSKNLFVASVYKVAFKHLPQPIISHIQGQLLKIPPLSTLNLHSSGGTGPPIFFGLES
jgi:hypothetical protein